MNLLAEAAIEGKISAYFCPTYKLLEETWRETLGTLEPVARRVDAQQKRIELHTGGVLDFWSTDGQAPARGRKYHLTVLDECAFEPRLLDVWQKAIRPTLTDFKGNALFISTPRGQEGFHELWQRGGQEDYPEWASWQMPSSTNPFLDPAELEAARRELPELVFRQEYLAEFVTQEGTLLKSQWVKVAEPPPGLTLRMGVDLAISQKEGADYSAAVLLGTDAQGNVFIVHAERVRASFHQVIEWIKSLAARWQPSVIHVEQVQFQAAVIQELLRTTNLPVKGVRPDRDKVTRFLPLQARYEQGLVYHVPNLPPEFRDELLSFPIGEHDDMVDAAAYAFMETQTPRFFAAAI